MGQSLPLFIHTQMLLQSNGTTAESDCTRASVQNIASVQDQHEDVNFGRLQTLLGQTILQVGAEGGEGGENTGQD